MPGPRAVQIDAAPSPRRPSGSGPIAEGVERNASVVKGRRKTVYLIVAGLFVVAAIGIGAAAFFLRRDSDDSAPGTVETNDSGSAARDAAPGADATASPVSGEANTASGTGTDVTEEADSSDVTPAGDAVDSTPSSGTDTSTTSGSTAAPGTESGTAAAAPAPVAAPVTPAVVNTTIAAASAPAVANTTTANATADAPALAPPVAAAPAPAPAAAPVRAAAFVVDATRGKFGNTIDWPVIPVAVASLPNGKILSWAAYVADDFDRDDRFVLSGAGKGYTQTATYDPSTNTVEGLEVANTEHDMFCPGLSMLFNGDILITGGQNALKTTIYKTATETWVPGEDMHISRGYGSSVTLSDGNVFVLGGSWSGPEELLKDGELYITATGEWQLLPGIPAAPILTADPEGQYRADNYGWFFAWTENSVFHAGPSEAMHWFDVSDGGSYIEIGDRPAPDSANGIAVMYAAGKIITAGGALAFAKAEYPSHADAVVIELGEAYGDVVTRVVEPLNFARAYAYGIAMPDGKVFVQGGADLPKEFSDASAVLLPEMWDPETETFTLMENSHLFARTYHSSATLMKDGRVFTGGGGLCGGCSVNHLNAEIYEPAYLYAEDGSLATRPAITLSAESVQNGGTFTVTSATPLAMVSLIRLGTATHSTNTDQRRLELCGRDTAPCGASPVALTIPTNPGIAVPGNWWVFGVDAAGVPSVGANLLVAPAA